MEKGKRLSSISEERKCLERGSAEKRRKSSGSQERRNKDVRKSPSTKGKQTKIPVPKPEKIESRSAPQSYSSTKLCCVTPKGINCGKSEDFNSKLKMLEEKEKSIAQYYRKVEDLILKLTETERNPSGNTVKRKTSQGIEARKMTSEPSVLNRAKTNFEILSDLENNVNQISKIWQEASSDLSITLKNLRNNQSPDPMEVELQKVRIQLAIKQAKSLTLIKTTDILAEAKRLFRHREMMRSELENVINYDKLSIAKCACQKDDVSLEDKVTSTSLKSENNKPVGGTGDSSKESHFYSHSDSQDINSTSNESSVKEREGTSGAEEGSFIKSTSKSDAPSSEEKAKNSDEASLKQTKLDASRTSSNLTKNVETWTKEMSKKNETIANLNNKVFELRKTCKEQSQQCNQLQVTLFQLTEKIQWNHVLRKQIGKLKEQIKGLQQSNKHLESQKRELECKITGLNLELDKLTKLNHFLNQKKHLLSTQENMDMEYPNMDYRRVEEWSRCKCDKPGKKSEKNMEEKILAEKQNAINQLKTILNVMKDQENFAQKQITVFQNKIEDLKKNAKS